VAYNIINATDSFLLSLKGFRDPDFLEQHGTCKEIAARTVEIKPWCLSGANGAMVSKMKLSLASQS
jgi:hypothetical protein